MDVTAIINLALLLASILLGCQAKPDKPTLANVGAALTCTKGTLPADCTSDSCTYKFYLGATSGGTLVKEVQTSLATPQKYTATQNGDYVCVLEKTGDTDPTSEDSTAVNVNTLARTPVIDLIPDSTPVVCGRQNLTVKCEAPISVTTGVAATYIRLMKGTTAVVDWTPVADIAKVVTTLSPLTTDDKDTTYTCQGATASTGADKSITDEAPVPCSACTATNCKDSPLGRITCNGTTHDCEMPKSTTPASPGQSTGQSVQTRQTDQTEQTSQQSGGDDSGSGTQKITLTLYLASLATIISLMTGQLRG